MSDLVSFKKNDLLNVAKKVGIHVLAKDTKKVLIEKINNYIETNPQKAVETIRAIKTVEESTDTTAEEEVRTLVDENDDDDDVEDDVEDVDTEDAAEEEEEEEDDDEPKDDPDYNAPPPFDVRTKVIDPIIEYVEVAKDKVYDFTDYVGITALQYSDNLRDQLSSTVTLNFAELLLEVLFFSYSYVPLVAIKDNDSIHQVFKDNIEFLSTSDLHVPDFTALIDWTVVSVLANWIIYAILLPLVISYFFNFTRRVALLEDDGYVFRVFSFDPFVFALSKVLIFFFIAQNHGALTSLSSYAGVFHAYKNFVLIQLGFFGDFVNALGNFPVVIGLFNVAITLYSQFEDLSYDA